MEKLLSVLHVIFVAMCAGLWSDAYMAMLLFAFSMEIPPFFGVLIITLPVSGFIVAYVVSSYRDTNVRFPKVIAIHKIPTIGRIGLPVGWIFGEKYGCFQIFDTQGCVRIIGAEVGVFEGGFPLSIPIADGIALQLHISALPDEGTTRFCSLTLGNKKFPGFVSVLSATKGRKKTLCFINACRADRCTVEGILSTFSFDY